MNKRKALTGLLAVVVCLLMIIPAYAAAITPQRTGQNKNHWCWATASMLVAENNGRAKLSHAAIVLKDTSGLHSYGGKAYYGVNTNGQYTAYGAQRKIVYNEFSNDKDNGGSDSNKESALQYASKDTKTIGTCGNYGSSISTTNLEFIQKELSDGRYVVGNLYAANFGGHSVVIAGYKPSTNQYRIIDPWDQTDVWYAYSNSFGSVGFPISGQRAPIQWIQYCN